MGDLQVCSFPENGSVLMMKCTATANVAVPQIESPDPVAVGGETWEAAEEVTSDIIRKIRPTVEANNKRKEVMEYVRGLIKSYLGFEVFPYGSVPLKTFLPDGDIDLTVITSPSIEDASVSDVHAVLRGEEQNEDAPYEVKDVHCIDAEVKLIKCIVQNIVVDVSFNQLGGLCTLCFLEQVDRHVGKNHLFKRSIILIKAWCYYESRILGAHHGLISTYALETLVLYIFHLFHSSLNGPLAVLYRFLDYFSRFDWENYCISLNGPVRKSSLPDVIVELPEIGKGELLLSDEFLKKCMNMFSIPSRSVELNSRQFPQKHLNIFDPLKENNNLGRSVNRGNFYRIRSAFKYGARKLGRILLLPKEQIFHELNMFFANTLDRHGSNYWTDWQTSALTSFPRSSDNSPSSLSSLSSSHSDTCFEDNLLKKSTIGYNNDRNFGNSYSGKSHHVPDSSSEGSFGENGKNENGISFKEMLENFITYNKMSWPEPEEFVINDFACSEANHEVAASWVSSPPDNVSRNSMLTLGEQDFDCISENSHSLNSLLDLSGDYQSHFRSVVYGQYCHLFSVSAPLLPSPPALPQLQNKNPWDTVCESIHWKQNICSQMKKNNIFGPQVYSVNNLGPLDAVFNCEDKRKQGTGTYIPNMSYYSYGNRSSFGRNRVQVSGKQGQLHRHNHENDSATTLQAMRNRTQAPGKQGQLHRPNHENDSAKTLQEMNSSECDHELSETEYPHLGNGKPVLPRTHPSCPSVWGSYKANGFTPLLDRIDTGSQGFQQQEGPSPGSITPVSGSFCAWGSASSPMGTAPQNPESDFENENEGDALHSPYQLKDEDDFPPLSHERKIEK